MASAGTVLAMTLSLEEAALAADRREPHIVWGVGCHPRSRKSQEVFSAKLFGNLVEQTAVVGEIGLDTGSRVPLARQLDAFRQALAVLACPPLQIFYWPFSGGSDLPALHGHCDTLEAEETMTQLKVIVEKPADGYVAYPLGLKGVVVGEGNSYEEALADVKSAIRFHIETFGEDVLQTDTPVLEAFVAETAISAS